jgi:cobalt-zinc-cadmium resistance protein CzcA
MLARVVELCIRYRATVLGLLALLFVAGGLAAARLPIDAMPDVSTIQVSILTKAPGLSPVQVERTVTVPMELALNGIPGGVEFRSVSRSGLSAVTVIFEEGTDVWFARQLVIERLRNVELPPSAEVPELAPVSTGLGEIYQFVVRSDLHTPMQLRTLLDWQIVPRLRSVNGVIEVNTQGGELKQYQVMVDPSRLRAHDLTLGDVTSALRSANMSVGGGYVERNDESFIIRARGLLHDEREIADVVIAARPDGAPILVGTVANVRIGPALRYGVITYNGEGEAVSGTVMMLLGSNSRDVVLAVKDRVEEVRRELPPGVEIEVVYDRSEFVGRTLTTVAKNLIEAIIIVTVVLALFLGTLRGALAVVLGIPASMSIALLGMHAFGVTGDLMSLGAIDFGFLVDGPIIVLEAVIAATAGKQLVGHSRRREYASLAGRVARPVAFSVAIITLVYLPLLSLEGVEGKMFRPMAITMACALFGALLFAIVFFPALLVVMVPPRKDHGPKWLEAVGRGWSSIAPGLLRWRWPLFGLAALSLALSAMAFAGAGANFVPRIFEGDALVTIRRSPSIGLDQARDLDLRVERTLQTFPEVVSTLGMTGRAEVAIDPVGNDNTDMLVRLRETGSWTTAHDFDALSAVIKARVESEVPGTFVSVSQPIEDKTNELISGSRADVAVNIFGRKIEELALLADKVGDRLKSIPGTGDVRIERLIGKPVIDARPDRSRMARHGVRVEDAFLAIAACREGITVGTIYEEQRRFDLRVLQPPTEPSADAIADLFVPAAGQKTIPLREVMTFEEGDGPVVVRRVDRQRTVRIDVNLRGRDLASWVDEARRVVASETPMPAGYHVVWGGQFENFERAKQRLVLVLPLSVAIIFGMLLLMFRNLRLAIAVFITVPFALTGGMLGLLARGYSFSLPAAVGFIALGGIAVLNGVVMAAEVRQRIDGGEPLREAVVNGGAHVVRAVLTTAAVAALGFLPMAIASSAGAEVQRPLATVVIVGILVGTLITMVVLPGILVVLLRGYRPTPAREEEEAEGEERAPAAPPEPSAAE